MLICLSILGGGRGNDLFQFMHADAFCRRNGVTFYSPTFTEKYCKDFPNLPKSPKTPYLVKKFLYNQYYRKVNPNCIIGFTDEKKIPKYRAQIKKDFLVNFCYGWFFNNDFYREEDIRHYQKLFDPNVDKETLKQKYLQLQSNEKLIGIHIRRGDYINLKHLYINLSMEYYIYEINYILNINPNIKNIIVFSDDINWCKNNLLTKFENVIFSENMDEYFDIILMSKCKYNIIANSTFSWWGGYLNSNLDKVVISPKKWFTEKMGLNESDIIPTSWIKI